MNNSEGCYFFALNLYKMNKRAGKNILIRDCTKGILKSCRRVGGFFKMEKNRIDAKKYFQIACERGDAVSCHDVAILEEDKNAMADKLSENCSNRGYDLSCRFFSALK